MAKRKAVDASDEQFKAAQLILDNGGTKKAACEALGIAYNTKRLGELLEEWHETSARVKAMRATKRKTAVTPDEIKNFVEDYLDGSTWDELSRHYHRSSTLIKAKISTAGGLIKQVGTVDPLFPPILPEECVALSFEIGEKVWVAAYQCLGEIRREVPGGYAVLLLDPFQQRNCNIATSELGSLKHLRDLGVNVDRLGVVLDKAECNELVSKAVRAANKENKR